MSDPLRSSREPAKPLPCPFCGVVPYVEFDSGTEIWEARCTLTYSPKCGVWPSALGDTSAEAIGVWNRRASREPGHADAGQEVRERLTKDDRTIIDRVRRDANAGFWIDPSDAADAVGILDRLANVDFCCDGDHRCTCASQIGYRVCVRDIDPVCNTNTPPAGAAS